jgi:hypothetical protein
MSIRQRQDFAGPYEAQWEGGFLNGGGPEHGGGFQDWQGGGFQAEPLGELHDPDPESNPDPKQFVQDTKRWSYHLANDPYGGAAGAWAKQFYDNPGIDPGGAIQNQISAFRRQYGDAAPDDDLGVMEMIASGRQPERPSSPTQAWNNAPTPMPKPGPVDVPPRPEPTTPIGKSNPELLALLMGRAKQGLAVNRDDPTVRAQVDPFTAQMERSSRNYLDDIAERGGGRPINLEGERRMASEKLGQQAGQFEGQVIGREVSARRDEIQNALSQWGDLLSQDEQIELQRELGYLNDRARTADRDTGHDEFLRQLALREWESRDQSDWRWLLG